MNTVPTKRRQATKKTRDAATYALFTGPAMILYLAFFVTPLLLSLFYSMQDWNGISTTFNFVGLKNYIDVLHEEAFLDSLGFTFKYMLANMIIMNAAGLLIALALNSNLKLKTALRGAYFLPIVISGVVVGYLWNIIIVRLFPIIGDWTGLELFTKNWPSYPNTAFAAIMIASVWQSFGYYMMIYLTGLQSVPDSLLEAAAIDGATPLQRFFHITVPIMRPTFTICIFLSMVNALKAFDIIYSLTFGGPYGSTTSISLQVFLDAFKRNLLSYASAKAMLFCLIIVIISFTQVALMKRKEVEL